MTSRFIERQSTCCYDRPAGGRISASHWPLFDAWGWMNNGAAAIGSQPSSYVGCHACISTRAALVKGFPPQAMALLSHTHSTGTSRTSTTTKLFQTESINQVADELISPKDVLCSERSTPSEPKAPRADPSTSHVMDKRHPSSFQQLEKVPNTQSSSCLYTKYQANAHV